MAQTPDHPRPEGRPGAAATLAALIGPLGVAGILGGAAVFAITGQFSKWSWIPMAAGAALLVFSLLSSPRQALAVLRRRGTRMGMNMAALMILVLAIAVLVNYVSSRRHHRFDFTRSKQHTLALQTRKILRGLKKEVTLVSFYSRRSPESEFEEMSDLLDEYRYGSDHIKTRLVDPYANPSEAQKYGVTSLSVTFVEGGNRKEQVYGPNEQDLTTAILKVTRDQKQKIYFLVGHGEYDPASVGPNSYSEAKRALEAAYYEVANLNLVSQGSVPKDCDVLVVAGAQKPLAEREAKAIEAYLAAGGKALLLVEPAPAPSLAEILNPWGVKPLPGVVVEPLMNLFGDAKTVVVTHYNYHEITRPFTEGRTSNSQFVTPRAFERDPAARPELRVADLLQTSSQSWLETNFSGKVAKEPDEKSGPLTIGLAVTTGPPPAPPGMPQPPPSEKETRHLVVIGDSDFATDNYFSATANGDLFLNAISWLAGESELVAIKPKPPEQHTIMLDQAQGRQTFVLSVLAVPLAVLFAGGYVWWRRR